MSNTEITRATDYVTASEIANAVVAQIDSRKVEATNLVVSARRKDRRSVYQTMGYTVRGRIQPDRRVSDRRASEVAQTVGSFCWGG